MLLSAGSRMRVPAELRQAPPAVLEDYVRARIGQYVSLLGQRLGHYAPGLGREAFERSAAEALACLPAGDHAQLALEDKQLQLVFRHDCLALGCLDPQCALCQHNPSRRCTVNFDRKYLVNDVLKARCGACIRVELIDPSTGMPVEEALPEILLQMCVLDGNMYDAMFLENGKTFEGGMEPPEELEACALLHNKKKSTPLLVCGGGSGVNDNTGFALLNMTNGKVQLADMHVTDSSEAILSGRKPPFRLLARVLQHGGASGNLLKIRHAVSEGFVVATRRTRTAGKADIPSVDDPIAKLDHMGKETIKKLQDLATAAQQAGVEIDIPENCVQRVGEFKLLALRADQDGHLRQKLQHVLKLSKEKWEEARDHAMRAVVADGRMRAWYADRRTCEVGILFTARLGNGDLEKPVGLLVSKYEGGERKTEMVLVAQLTPTQRDVVRHLHPQAVAAWWMQGHPGWAIFHMDTEAFLQQFGYLAGSATGTGAPPSGPATATTSMDAPGSPSQSCAVSQGGEGGAAVWQQLPSGAHRRRTSGSGGGANVSMSTQSTDAGAALDSSFMLGGKQLQQQQQQQLAPTPAQPLLAGYGGTLAAPQPQLGFAGRMGSYSYTSGSGRSSQATSATDSPPPLAPHPLAGQQQWHGHGMQGAGAGMLTSHQQPQAGGGGPFMGGGHQQQLHPQQHFQHLQAQQQQQQNRGYSDQQQAGAGPQATLVPPQQQQQLLPPSQLMPPPQRMVSPLHNRMPQQQQQQQPSGSGPPSPPAPALHHQQQRYPSMGLQNELQYHHQQPQQHQHQQHHQHAYRPQQQQQQQPDFGPQQPRGEQPRGHAAGAGQQPADKPVPSLAAATPMPTHPYAFSQGAGPGGYNQFRSFSASVVQGARTAQERERDDQHTDDELPSRGSANPRPHKMASMGRHAHPDSEPLTPGAGTAAAPSPPLPQSHPQQEQQQQQLPDKPNVEAGPASGGSGAGPASGGGGGGGGKPGPPPNPFLRVQSGRHADPNPDDDDQGRGSDSDDDPLAALAALPSLPLNSGIFSLSGMGMSMGMGAASNGGAPAPQQALQRPQHTLAGGLQPGQGQGLHHPQQPHHQPHLHHLHHHAGGGGGGQPHQHGQPSGLGEDDGSGGLLMRPSLQMFDSQQLEMVLGEPGMMLEAPSLTGMSAYGLFMPPGMAMPDGLPTTQSKELLRPTTSGLDTMASIEVALPELAFGRAGQTPSASAGAGGNSFTRTHVSGPYAR